MQFLQQAVEQSILPRVRSGEIRIVPQQARPEALRRVLWEIRTQQRTEHTHFEWMWLLSGNATLKIDGHIYSLQPGDCCFLPPLTPHCDVFDSETPAYTSLWFAYWPAGILHACLFEYQPLGQWNVPHYAAVPAGFLLGTVIDELQIELQHRERMHTEAIHGLMLQLVVLVLRSLDAVCAETSKGSLTGNVSHQVRQYLRAHFAEKVTLREAARAMHLSPNYLATVFKRETGQTIHDVLTEIRLEQATLLLLEENVSIEEIARIVGFERADTFSRAFRREKGVSPSRYGFFQENGVAPFNRRKYRKNCHESGVKAG